MSEKISCRAGEKGKEGGGPYLEILRRINEKGPITFREFMEVALYWRDGGYYTRGGVWGGEGDYITSLDVSPAFSSTIAKEVSEMWKLLGSPVEFELIEAGAGRGTLSKGVLETLNTLEPSLHRALRARLVERGAAPGKLESQTITVHRDISELLPAANGVILTNELIDSFPVHRVVWDGGLKEIYVGHDGTGFFETAGEPSTGELPGYFDVLGVRLFPGQRAEANLAAREWIKRASALIKKGFVVVIDYGLPARELYSLERMGGTLLCHFRHTINDNPYINIGLQDITSHVDFTTLAREGREAGLEVTGFTTQKNFLLGLGVLEELGETGGLGPGSYDTIARNRSIAELISPGGMGDAFKVLVLHKGVEKPALRGFSFKDMSSYL